jgi:valyl-tRNA synthetase
MFTYFKHKKIPFKNLFLTGLVLGSDGQKMSKSKGNIVDTDKIREAYGTDSIRMAYFYQNSAGGSYLMSDDKLKNFKQFNNKLWNATRFVLMRGEISNSKFQIPNLEQELSKKLIQHITEVKTKVTKNMNNYEFGYATDTLYNEFWHTFCDVYIEESKKYLMPKLVDGVEIKSDISEEAKQEVASVMVYVLKEYLKMLHPFIPFITEKIWQEMPKGEGDHKSLMYSRW